MGACVGTDMTKIGLLKKSRVEVGSFVALKIYSTHYQPMVMPNATYPLRKWKLTAGSQQDIRPHRSSQTRTAPSSGASPSWAGRF